MEARRFIEQQKKDEGAAGNPNYKDGFGTVIPGAAAKYIRVLPASQT
jgi:hypothetical protein